nr:MAG TPA: hypothetical protein [Caudoviricetes sp.]
MGDFLKKSEIALMKKLLATYKDELLQKACEFNPPNRELAHLSNKVKNAVLDINDAECLLKKLQNKETK